MAYIAADLRGIISGAFQSRRIMLKRPLSITCAVLLCLLTLSSAAAQKSTATPDPDPTMTTSYQQVVVYAGPGITYQQNNLLNPGIPAQIVERNAVGTWLHLQRVADESRSHRAPPAFASRGENGHSFDRNSMLHLPQ